MAAAVHAAVPMATSTGPAPESDHPAFHLTASRRVECPTTGVVYELGEQLGAGAAAVVFRCRRVKQGEGITVPLASDVEYAAKVVDLRKLRLRSDFEREREKIRREVSILSRLHHPCIVDLFHVIETTDELFLIMELVRGGELFFKIVECGALSENQARFVLIQLLSALEYMHGKGVIHRDLKPENILISGESAEGFFQVQIADFGLAKLIRHGISEAKTFVGTPQYWAPEVINANNSNDSYGPEADLWSLGCVIYVMLGGAYPFDSRIGPIDMLIKSAHYHFRYPRFATVSESAKSLIRGLLTVDPQSRLSLREIREHPWVRSYVPPPYLLRCLQNINSIKPVPLTVAAKSILAETKAEITLDKKLNNSKDSQKSAAPNQSCDSGNAENSDTRAIVPAYCHSFPWAASSVGYGYARPPQSASPKPAPRQMFNPSRGWAVPNDNPVEDPVTDFDALGSSRPPALPSNSAHSAAVASTNNPAQFYPPSAPYFSHMPGIHTGYPAAVAAPPSYCPPPNTFNARLPSAYPHGPTHATNPLPAILPGPYAGWIPPTALPFYFPPPYCPIPPPIPGGAAALLHGAAPGVIPLEESRFPRPSYPYRGFWNVEAAEAARQRSARIGDEGLRALCCGDQAAEGGAHMPENAILDERPRHRRHRQGRGGLLHHHSTPASRPGTDEPHTGSYNVHSRELSSAATSRSTSSSPSVSARPKPQDFHCGQRRSSAYESNSMPRITDKNVRRHSRQPHRGSYGERPPADAVARAAKGLFNFNDLLCLQIFVLSRFHWACLALRQIPDASKILLRTTCQVQDLHENSVDLIAKFEGVCNSVLEVLPDLTLAAAEDHVDLASDFLNDITKWVTEFTKSVNEHQQRLADFVLEVSVITETIRSMKLSSEVQETPCGLPCLPHPSIFDPTSGSDFTGVNEGSNERYPCRLNPDTVVLVDEAEASPNTAALDHARWRRASTDLLAETYTIPSGTATPSVTPGGRDHSETNSSTKTGSTSACDFLYSAAGGKLLDGMMETLPGPMTATVPSRTMSKDCKFDQLHERISSGEQNGFRSQEQSMPAQVEEEESYEGASFEDAIEGNPPPMAGVMADSALLHGCKEVLRRLQDYDAIDIRSGEVPHVKSSKKEHNTRVKSGSASGVKQPGSGPSQRGNSVLENDMNAAIASTTGPASVSSKNCRFHQFNEDTRSWKLKTKIMSSALKASDVFLRALDEMRRVTHILRQISSFWSQLQVVIQRLSQMQTHMERLLRHSSSSHSLRERFYGRLDEYYVFWSTLRCQARHHIASSRAKAGAMRNLALALENVAVSGSGMMHNNDNIRKTGLFISTAKKLLHIKL